MQLRPRLTSASGSPCVATTRLSFTATVTPQPVPQKRHGAFDHLTPGSVSALESWAAPGTGMPATAPAAAAADCLMNSLRVVPIANGLVHGCQGAGVFIDQGCGQHAVDPLDAPHLRGHPRCRAGLE